MKTAILAILLASPVCTPLTAGSINVIHLGPRDVLKFEVRAGEAAQDFTLSHGADSGPFFLPEKPVTLKGFVEEVPSLEIPVSEKPRIAILAPGEKGYSWHLLEAKPVPEKWAFRVVNLSPEEVEAQSGETTLKIPAGGETTVDVSKKPQISLRITDAVEVSYGGNEPCGVVAFIYRKDGQWHAICLPDR